MTPRGSRSVPENSAAAAVCSRCAAKIMPYFRDNAVASHNQIDQLISENLLTVKGAALFLPRGNGASPSSVPSITQRPKSHTGDLQHHLQTMFTLLRSNDTIRLAVRLESAYSLCTRYMVVVSTNGRQDTEESVVLGMDFSNSDRSQCTVGLVLPLWSDTLIHLDGDGGFSVSTVNRVHIFKPVSVQAMWSALQSLHKACEVARCHNYYPGSLFLTWVSYYQTCISSEQQCINEWNAMQDVQSHRSDSPVLFTDLPTERERTERLIKTRLREIMMQKDLENVTSKEIRSELEMQMVCNLREFKEFIDNEMIVILGQMDSPTEIFDHVYLGSEWNASNLDELQSSGVRYILNVTREIDNFFPGLFEYHNIRVYDDEATNLLEYWNDTYKFISKAKKAGVKCLVHCKMGVSRSASTVIAYAMKEYGWDLDRAFEHVRERRTVTKPNPSFMKQLEEYQGILLASKQRHNKLWRSHSDGDLSEQQEPACKSARTLSRSEPHKSSGAHSINNMPQTISSQHTGSSAETENSNTELPAHPSSQNQEHVTPSHTAAVAPGCILKVIESVACPQPSPNLPECPLSTSQHGHKSSEPKTDEETLGPVVPEQNDSRKHTHFFGTRSLGLGLDAETRVGEKELQLVPSGTSMTLRLCDIPLESTRSASRNAETCTSEEKMLRWENSSSSGTDSIDFFRAREKFQDLSRESCHGVHEAVTPRTTPAPNPQTVCADDWNTAIVEEGSAHSESLGEAKAPPTAELEPFMADNDTSVRHITSEPESVSSLQPPSRVPEQAALQKQQLAKEEVETKPAADFIKAEARKREEEETRLLEDDDSGIIPDTSTCTATVCPSLNPSSSSSPLLWLESDAEDVTASPHDLRKIQETLQELQAFLYEAGGMEACFTYSQQPRTLSVWQKAMEMEARIRQAGLTPPSLLKRSASLAKLDQLEISTHDLNDWEFGAEVPPSPSCSSFSHVHLLCSNQDEVHKKQRVLPQTVSELDGTESSRHAPFSFSQHEQDSSMAQPTHTSARCTQQQHTKPHSIRWPCKAADKKKPVSMLYNTM